MSAPPFEAMTTFVIFGSGIVTGIALYHVWMLIQLIRELWKD